MFCFYCGKPVDETQKSCPSCGTAMTEILAHEMADSRDADSASQHEAPQQRVYDAAAAVPTQLPFTPPSKTVKKKNHKRTIIIAAGLTVVIAAAVFIFFYSKNDYWPKKAPDTSTIETAKWEFDSGDILKSVDVDEPLAIISVSPSGKYILAANQITQNIQETLPAGIPNRLGRLPESLYVFTNRNGVYTKTSSIAVGADLELSSTLGVCREDGVAWSKDETRAVFTVGNGKDVRAYIRDTHSNIYLVDFSKQTFNKLTDSRDGGSFNLLPQWVDNDNIRFIHWEFDSNGSITSLMGLNLKTGREELVSDLSADGSIKDYMISGESVYFSKVYMSSLEYSGLYKAKLDGGKTPPTCLLNMQEIQEDNIHPYAYFTSMQISPDGRWACLCMTDVDPRLLNRDIPLADDPKLPQTDLSSAISQITGQAWIPGHDVFLYDLKNNKLVDPFVDKRLNPDVVIATAATFAPDGKSLLCAVIGDGGEWTTESYDKTTLYQIRLYDGSFKAVRIFKTDVLETPTKLSWLENNSLLIRGYGIPPDYPVQIIIPAAFERFAG